MEPYGIKLNIKMLRYSTLALCFDLKGIFMNLNENISNE